MKRKRRDILTTPPTSIGALIAAWRSRVLGITQKELGDSFTADNRLTGAAISLLESEARGKHYDNDRLDTLDRYFGADGALIDMARALGSVDGLPARNHWHHNFRPGGDPVWIWIRPAPTSQVVSGVIRWGPLRMPFDQPVGSSGVIITSPTSVANPPIQVILNEPGWVDFGAGAIPNELGFTLISGPARTVAGLAPSGPRKMWHILSVGRPSAVSDELPVIDEYHRLTGWELDRLRAARALTLSEAARLVTELDEGEPATDKTITRLQDGLSVQPKFAQARLDMVYGADGYSCCESIHVASPHRDDGGHYVLRFPDYWVGPIWIVADGPDKDTECQMRLQWGAWHRETPTRSGQAFANRRARAGDPWDLEVFVPDGWRIEAGVGRRDDSLDIIGGWYLKISVKDVIQKIIQLARGVEILPSTPEDYVIREVAGAYLLLAKTLSVPLKRLGTRLLRHEVHLDQAETPLAEIPRSR